MLVVGFLFVIACNANAQKEPASDFKRIFQVISSRDALSTSFQLHMEKMGALCAKQDASESGYAKKGNVKCISTTAIPELDMSATASLAVTMIDATIAGIEKCTYMRSILIQEYGKPAESQGNCDSKWLVKRSKGKPLVHIVLEENAKKDVVYFGNEQEQGP